jgi:hypothetical protein
MDAPADLLVRSEADAQRAVRQVGVLDQVARHRHDDGDAGLVIGSEQGRPAGGDDVVAGLRRQVGPFGW